MTMTERRGTSVLNAARLKRTRRTRSHDFAHSEAEVSASDAELGSTLF